MDRTFVPDGPIVLHYSWLPMIARSCLTARSCCIIPAWRPVSRLFLRLRARRAARVACGPSSSPWSRKFLRAFARGFPRVSIYQRGSKPENPVPGCSAAPVPDGLEAAQTHGPAASGLSAAVLAVACWPLDGPESCPKSPSSEAHPTPAFLLQALDAAGTNHPQTIKNPTKSRRKGQCSVTRRPAGGGLGVTSSSILEAPDTSDRRGIRRPWRGRTRVHNVVRIPAHREGAAIFHHGSILPRLRVLTTTAACSPANAPSRAPADRFATASSPTRIGQPPPAPAPPESRPPANRPPPVIRAPPLGGGSSQE